MGDASAGGHFRIARRWSLSLSPCWLQLILPGHAQRRLYLRDLRGWGSHDLGTVTLDSSASDPNPTVHVNTLLASPAARKAYQSGLRALRKAKPNFDAAASHLAEAVRIHPQYATAWAARGEALMALGRSPQAKAAFRRAIDEDPMLLAPHESLLKVALEEENWPEVESLTKSYLKISPTSARARFYGALAAVNLRKGEDVEAIIKKMKDLGEVETWTTAHYMMAMVHSWRTEFEEAAREFEAFLDRSPDHTLARNANSLLYEWTKLEVIQPRDFPDGPPWVGDHKGL
ncbi:MAG: tetratricopeptide repeat protein [Bryobacterales bacterium]|nr:tetratricopeptide repeat protein [Bryobacterales bacterium]